MSHVPAATIAKALRMSERRVRQLRQEGVFPKEAHGQYDLAKCIVAHHHYLQDKDRQRNGENGGEAGSLTAERERRLRVQRERDELRLAKERGSLIPIETYQHEVSQAFSSLRERFLALSRIAPELEGQPAAAIKSRLDAEVRDMLTSLAYGDSAPNRQPRKPRGTRASAPASLPSPRPAPQPQGERVGGPEPLPSQGK